MDTPDQPIPGRRTSFGTHGIATCPRNGTLPAAVSSSHGNAGIALRSRNAGYALPHPHYAQRSSLYRLLPSVQPPRRPKVSMAELLTPLGELLNATCGRYLQGRAGHLYPGPPSIDLTGREEGGLLQPHSVSKLRRLAPIGQSTYTSVTGSLLTARWLGLDQGQLRRSSWKQHGRSQMGVSRLGGS